MVVGMPTVDLLLVHLKLEFDAAGMVWYGIMHQSRGVGSFSETCDIIAKPTTVKISTERSRCQNYIPEVGRNDRGRNMSSARAISAASAAATIRYPLTGYAKIARRRANTRVYPLFQFGGQPTLAVANVQI